jgi:hypothetical protein
MIFRNRRTRPFHWLKLGTERGQMAGRVQIGQNIGSGLVMDGGVVGERYAGLPLFFTALHVIPGEFRSLPKDITIIFDALTDDPQGGMARVERLLAASPANQLNYSVALLDRWPGRVPPVNLCPRNPAPGDLIFLLGFPRGRGLEVSLDDNEVLAPDQQHARPALPNPEDVLLYGAPTEPGSSGSPVFNENWELAAIHIGADRKSRTNFGARIHAVVADATAKLENLWLEQEVVARIKAAGAPKPEYMSVFISYSRADEVFADRLFNSLRSEGVHAWYDKQNILPGYDIYDEITRGIREQDKVLFCFSESAIRSGWVDAEIDRALQKERELFRTTRDGAPSSRSRSKTLIPLDLDGSLIEGRWQSGKAPDLMSRGIADFRNWQDQSTFTETFTDLLSSLRAAPPVAAKQ